MSKQYFNFNDPTEKSGHVSHYSSLSLYSGMWFKYLEIIAQPKSYN